MMGVVDQSPGQFDEGTSSTMTFKKDGADPVGPFNIGLRWVGAAFAALGIGVNVPQPEDEHRYRRSRRKVQHRNRRRNMLHVSKRVRRKHRRAA